MSLRIAEVAQRSGVPASTLRYYDQIGLVPTGREGNGYRAYPEDVLDRLRYRSVRYQFSVARLPGRARQGAVEHGAVVRAVVAGKADEAEREMRAHLESVIGALYDLQTHGGLYGVPSPTPPTSSVAPLTSS